MGIKKDVPYAPNPAGGSPLSWCGRGLSVTPAVWGFSTVLKPLKPLDGRCTTRSPTVLARLTRRTREHGSGHHRNHRDRRAELRDTHDVQGNFDYILNEEAVEATFHNGVRDLGRAFGRYCLQATNDENLKALMAWPRWEFLQIDFQIV